jgi:hypothetical protein
MVRPRAQLFVSGRGASLLPCCFSKATPPTCLPLRRASRSRPCVPSESLMETARVPTRSNSRGKRRGRRRRIRLARCCRGASADWWLLRAGAEAEGGGFGGGSTRNLPSSSITEAPTTTRRRVNRGQTQARRFPETNVVLTPGVGDRRGGADSLPWPSSTSSQRSGQTSRHTRQASPRLNFKKISAKRTESAERAETDR